MSTIDTSTEAVKWLLENVTPGPWYRDAWDIRSDGPGTGAICEVAKPNGDDDRYWKNGEADANARFIAAARTLVPALLKERDDLRAKLTEARAELHGPIKPLSAQDYSNVIAHLSPELEPNGELPNRNSLMMALVEATNAAKREAASADWAEAMREAASPDQTTRLQARVKVLDDALWVAQAHVANNAQGWSVGRGASRDDLAIVDAALAASIPAVQETGIDIAAIENGGRRWHGEDHRVVSVRWEPYKPDGQRQMKAKGRWQEQVGSGDYWRWQNCDRPAALAASQTPDPVTNADCQQPEGA